MVDFSQLMSDLLDEQEEEISDPRCVGEFWETVVPNGAEIRSDPLLRLGVGPLLAIR
jgi:hypothetical protein